jgi:two-component system LytT family sensor kinase
LDALRAQVNPHFLFNALNSLRALIEENPARARDAVTRLASILRYSLSTDSDATVPFGIELDFVTDYLELELLRFEDRLTATKRIQPETLVETGRTRPARGQPGSSQRPRNHTRAEF